MNHLRKFNEVWEPTLPNKYYKTLDNVPANLMNGNIKYNSID